MEPHNVQELSEGPLPYALMLARSHDHRPPSMLEYKIVGQIIAIRGDGYTAYVKMWAERAGGTNPIPGTSPELSVFVGD